MLHVFLPPQHTPADCSPYATWRLTSTGSSVLPGAQAPKAAGVSVSVMLAVAWQHSVSVYNAVLLQQRWQQPAAAVGSPPQQQLAQPLPPPMLLRSWTAAGSSSVTSLAGSPAGSSSNTTTSGSGVAVSSAHTIDAPGVCGCYFMDLGPLVRQCLTNLPVWCIALTWLTWWRWSVACGTRWQTYATVFVVQVVLSSLGETATAVHVYRPDWYSSDGSAGRPNAGGNTQDGGEAEEVLVLRDWLVGSQVGSGCNRKSHCTSLLRALQPWLVPTSQHAAFQLPCPQAEVLFSLLQALVSGSNNSFHQSVSGFGDQLLLLNSQGVVRSVGKATTPALLLPFT